MDLKCLSGNERQIIWVMTTGLLRDLVATFRDAQALHCYSNGMLRGCSRTPSIELCDNQQGQPSDHCSSVARIGRPKVPCTTYPKHLSIIVIS
jgi:hypothetical protein